jgi:hypothetical protein
MIMSVHVQESGQAAALRTYAGGQIEPGTVQGLRYARTYLTANLRRGLVPSLAVTGTALFTAWDDDESLDRFEGHRKLKPYSEGWRVRMHPARSIGLLPGLPDLPRRELEIPAGRPVVAYTVGHVRASRFLPFIKAAGAAEREAAAHPGFYCGITLLKPPLVIGTLSVWRSLRDMREYTLGDRPGGHRRAMDADRRMGFNTDMFFSRYLPYSAGGAWKGSNPLESLRDLEPPSVATNGADVATAIGRPHLLPLGGALLEPSGD